MADAPPWRRRIRASLSARTRVGGLRGVGLCAARKAERFQLWMRSLGELAIGPGDVVHPRGLDMLIFGCHPTLRADPLSSDRLTATWTPFTETRKTPSMSPAALQESDFRAREQSDDDTALWGAFLCLFSGPRQPRQPHGSTV